MIRVFLDANVLFTAARNRSGKAALVIELGIRGALGIGDERLRVRRSAKEP